MRINKNQFLVLILLFATIVNIVVHLSSPAYKEYKSAVSRLDDEFSNFRNQVLKDFIPSVTNVLAKIRTSSVSFSNPSFDFSITNSPSFSSDNFERSSKFSDPKSIAGYCGFCNGRAVFHCSSSGWDFFVGDSFDGFPILDISKQSLTTALCVYRVVPPVNVPSSKVSDSSPL